LTRRRLVALGVAGALAALGLVVALAMPDEAPDPPPDAPPPLPAAAPPPLPPPAPPPPHPPKTTVARVDGWRFRAGPPPPGWSDPGFDDHDWAGPVPGPFLPRSPAPAPAPPTATLYDLVPRAPLLLRGRFAVAEPARVRVLELAIAYADGFVATLNGHEVARRGLAAGGGAAPMVPHGPETDRIMIAVPSPQLPELRADGNLLAIAVYPYPGRSVVVPRAPAASVAVSTATGVRFVRGPYLAAPVQDDGGAGVSVVWQTDLPARATVIVERAADAPGGDEPARLPLRLMVDRATTDGMVKLEGLATGAAYRYRVEVTAASNDKADGASVDKAVAGPTRFATMPAAPAPVRFAVYGDTRYPGHAAHRAVVEALVREAPPVVFMTGDLTDDGSDDANWQRFFEITAPLGAIAPLVPAFGNHDAARGGVGVTRAWAMFGVPPHPPPGWTSFDLGGVHFVILDSNDMRDPAQRKWLADDLAAAHRRHARAVFAFCHEGPWSHALHGGERIMARDFAPLLAAGHVDVVFSGHDHVYERGVGETSSGPLTYIVSGGGGAPLYDPACTAPAAPLANGGPPVANGGPPVANGGGAAPPPCPAGVAFIAKTTHYVMVEVAGDTVTLCPRRPDGSPVEPCVKLPARR